MLVLITQINSNYGKPINDQVEVLKEQINPKNRNKPAEQNHEKIAWLSQEYLNHALYWCF